MNNATSGTSLVLLIMMYTHSFFVAVCGSIKFEFDLQKVCSCFAST